MPDVEPDLLPKSSKKLSFHIEPSHAESEGSFLEDLGPPRRQVSAEDRVFDAALNLIGCGYGVFNATWLVVIFISIISALTYDVLWAHKVLWQILTGNSSANKDSNRQLLMSLLDLVRVLALTSVFAFVRRLRGVIWNYSRRHWRNRLVLIFSLFYIVPSFLWRLDFILMMCFQKPPYFETYSIAFKLEKDRLYVFLRIPNLILLLSLTVFCCLFGGWVRHLRKAIFDFRDRLEECLQNKNELTVSVEDYYRMREECAELSQQVREPMNCLLASLLASVAYYMVQINSDGSPWWFLALPQFCCLLWLTWKTTGINQKSDLIVDVLRSRLRMEDLSSEERAKLVELRTCMECDPVGWFVAKNVPMRRRSFYCLAIPIWAKVGAEAWEFCFQ